MRSVNVKQLNHGLRSRCAKLALLSLATAAMHGNVVNDGMAAFSLNWARDYSSEGASFNNSDGYIVCHMSYISRANCRSGGFGGDFNENGSHDDGTAFMQEELNLGGQSYFHVIVGDHTRDSMAQEVFITTSGSYSGVGLTTSVASTSSTRNAEFNMDNPYSTDSTKTGSGSANPNNVIMRQIINSGEISMEFLKASFSKKPQITQTITNAEMVSTVSMDKRGRNYSQITPIDPSTSVVNTLVLTGSNRAATDGNYDLQVHAQTSHISAGGFTYTNGSGNGNGGGVYTWYAPVDPFQPLHRNYAVYCDPTQNSDWSGNGACINGSGGGSGGGGW